jgi:hypothetical protein
MSKIEVNAIEPQCGTTLTVGAVGTTVTVPSNVVKSNALQASDAGNIISQSGTTITLGATGDSINLASGATQSGFGPTGAVSWNTTKTTADPNPAVTGVGYFADTTSAAFTITLPTSPSAGDIVAISDYAGTFSTNNLTVARNGSNIRGSAADLILYINNQTVTLVYIDGTQGWNLVQESNNNSNFISATGGSITCSGDYRIHTFTGPGTFTVTSAGTSLGSNSVDYMVVAGGGGGSASAPNSSGAGGAGAGGFRESSGTASGSYSASPLGACVSALPVSVQGYSIVVGAGGAAGTTASVPSPTTHGAQGSPSTFSSITSTGGGRSGAADGTPAAPGGPSGQPGGSGGGTSNYDASPGATAGSGNTPPVSPPQGNPGGINGAIGGTYPTGGGGGATAAGDSPNGGPNTDTARGFGGAGATTSISGSPTAYAGGGGGSFYGTPGQASGGTGGGGGGGNAPAPNQRPGQAGTANRGGGGGGGVFGLSGGAGGSGIVIIRYKFQ